MCVFLSLLERTNTHSFITTHSRATHRRHPARVFGRHGRMSKNGRCPHPDDKECDCFTYLGYDRKTLSPPRTRAVLLVHRDGNSSVVRSTRVGTTPLLLPPPIAASASSAVGSATVTRMASAFQTVCTTSVTVASVASTATTAAAASAAAAADAVRDTPTDANYWIQRDITFCNACGEHHRRDEPHTGVLRNATAAAIAAAATAATAAAAPPVAACAAANTLTAGNLTHVNPSEERLAFVRSRMRNEDLPELTPDENRVVTQLNMLKTGGVQWWIDPRVVHENKEEAVIGRRTSCRQKFTTNKLTFYRMFVELPFEIPSHSDAFSSVTIEYRVTTRSRGMDRVTTTATSRPFKDEVSWWPHDTPSQCLRRDVMPKLMEVLFEPLRTIRPLIQLIGEYIPNVYLYLLPLNWTQSMKAYEGQSMVASWECTPTLKSAPQNADSELAELLGLGLTPLKTIII